MRSTVAGAVGLFQSLLIYYAIPFQMRRMRRFYRQFIGPEDLAFDIGAHLGNRVRAWSGLGATVVAVEPQPVCLPILRAIVARKPQVHLVEQAVSDSSHPLTLHLSSRHPSLATVSSHWVSRASEVSGFSHVKWDHRITVPTCTVDELISRFGKPRFIKIDVEGHEDHVLSSLTVPVESVSFEFLHADRDVAFRCIDRLQTLSTYEFNLSPGETLRFHCKNWVSGDEVKTWLRALPSRVTSGDVYARQRT